MKVKIIGTDASVDIDSDKAEASDFLQVITTLYITRIENGEGEALMTGSTVIGIPTRRILSKIREDAERSLANIESGLEKLEDAD
jgi:hypothetical protein